MSALGIFAGRLGAYNLAKAGYPQPQQALELAEKLDSRGVSPQEIYKRTSEYLKDTPFAGVTKLKDGQFRFEIPDNEMKIIRTKRPFGDVLQLDQAIEHPLFFKAYPQMSRREIQFTRDWERPGTLGTYSPSGSIEVNIEPLDPAVLAHELNHAAQHFEGDLYPETVQARDYSTYADYEKAFFHQPWEAEAEETRYRFPLTPPERRANPPFYSMPSEVERPFPYPRGAQSADQILEPQRAPVEWQSWMGELPEGYGPPKPGPGIFERGIERVRRVLRDELDRENHGMPRYAEGGTPPIGEPAIVGEQGNVQLTPVDHDPFDDTLAQRARLPGQFDPQQAADFIINAAGPLGDAGMIVGDWMRTGGRSFDTRDISPAIAGVMLGTAAGPGARAGEIAPEVLEGLTALFEGTAQGSVAKLGAKITPEIATTDKAIRAYHGSPHSFEQFDASKIGTGEGAQAFGHGLYFAENPRVAASYRTAGQRMGSTLDSAKVNSPAFSKLGAYDQRYIDQVLANIKFHFSGPSIPEAIAYQRERALSTSPSWLHPPMRPDLTTKVFDDIEQKLGTLPKGHNYEVAIKSNPESFVDLDKPLSDQSEYVKNLLFNVVKVPRDTDIKDYVHGPEVAARLREAGIPGIRYFDQKSRATGEGTRNYVVFDPSTVDIIRKFGLAGLIGAGAAHFTANDAKTSEEPDDDNTITLQPVEHDPFLPYAGYKPSGVTLTPVDHDPFN